jgi:membrane-associated PAP2 superfamily phosphatase
VQHTSLLHHESRNRRFNLVLPSSEEHKHYIQKLLHRLEKLQNITHTIQHRTQTFSGVYQIGTHSESCKRSGNAFKVIHDTLSVAEVVVMGLEALQQHSYLWAEVVYH